MKPALLVLKTSKPFTRKNSIILNGRERLEGSCGLPTEEGPELHQVVFHQFLLTYLDVM